MLSVEVPDCIFCQIIRRSLDAYVVYEDANTFAFLDNNPLFPGHVLLCPREHYETLPDLPGRLIEPVFATTQMLAKAVEAAVDAEGTFIAMNNHVSQQVPHLHVHIVPRRRKDGLRGFFWPRQKYQDAAASKTVRDAISREVRKLLAASH